MTPDGRYIIRSFLQHVEVSDGRTGELEHLLLGFESVLLAYAAGSDLLLTTTAEGEVRLWSLTSGRLILRERVGPSMRLIAVSPNDREFAVLEDDRVLFFPIVSRTLPDDALVRLLRAAYSKQAFTRRYVLEPLSFWESATDP